MKIMAGLAVALLVLSARMYSQELNCDVTVNVENIPSAQRDFLTRFEACELYSKTNKVLDYNRSPLLL